MSPPSPSRAILKGNDTPSVTVLLKRPTLFSSLIIALSASLSACTGSPIEESLAPDPNLKDNPPFSQQGPNSDNPNQPQEGLTNGTSTEPSPTTPSSSPTDSQEPSTENLESSSTLPSPSVESSPMPQPSPAGTIPEELLQLGKDLPEVPEGLRSYVADLSKLGALKPGQQQRGETPVTTQSLAKPNQPVSRRDFARWLVEVNNRMYAKRPGKLIRMAAPTDQPAFKDVPNTDPDFLYIQGLAEAGLIPSSLSGDTNSISFGPDEPVTREQLILWKVPLDTRQPLPKTAVENVTEAWGFQDASKIDTNALKAVMVDFSNGDFSNIRRVFGFTTLFQPKAAVTRAEAAASLWYFGFQGDGVSAEELLKANSNP